MIRPLALLCLLLVLHEISAQDRCTTPEKKAGTCINIRECQALVDILKTQQPLSRELLDYLNSLQCGFEGTNPKVCCEQQGLPLQPSSTTEPPVVTSTVPDPPDVSTHPNLRLLNDDDCGPVAQQRIVGGNKTGVFDYPWMALLFYNTGRPVPEYRCGGSLITKRYVLTAAHCVTSLPPNLSLIGVRLGDHNLATERDCDKEADGLEVVCAERYQDFGIESTHFHPEYSRAKLHNDIALLRLNGDADFRPQNVRPVCMPIGSAVNMSKKKVTITGWGATELGPRSQELLQVQLSLVDTDECAKIYKKKTQIWYKQICAGGKRGMDSCSGDSGGPLQTPEIYEGNVKYIQYGIVSFGPNNCGTEGAPGVYTRITYYMDWILNTIRD